MNWDELIDEGGLAKLLPAEYQHFSKPVKEGLTVFLSGLSPERQAEILGAQATLPHSAAVSQRLGLLARSCPVLHKLGQTLARDRRLHEEFRHELQQLESLPPTVDTPTIEKILTADLGPLDRRGIKLPGPAIAEASVAVVIPFTQTGVDENDAASDGVFKVLKPGIEARLEEELNLMADVGAHLDERCDKLGIPHLDYQDSFQQVREKLLCEVQLDLEQHNLLAARRFYEDQPQILIPAVLPHCSHRVTAMERVTGGKVTDCPHDSSSSRQRLAALVARALISHPLFARHRPALFHSDPHAGNLFQTNDGRLAILDWSLAGSLFEAERIAVNQIMLGALTLHTGKVIAELENLAERKEVDRAALAGVVESWLRRIRRGAFPGINWLLGLLDDATQVARLRVAADLMLFRKALLTMEGVLSELGAPEHCTDQVLITDFLSQFCTEWLHRWFAVPSSRNFGTRLSNADLTEAVLNVPGTIMRFWTDESLDALRYLSKSHPA